MTSEDFPKLWIKYWINRKTLLIKNEGNKINFVTKDDNGDIEFNGNKFVACVGKL